MSSNACIGIILAGGLSRRMGGGDKPLTLLGGAPLLSYTVAALRPQCSRLVLSANGDLKRFANFDLPCVADDLPGHQGPLAGVLAGLDWAAKHSPEMLLALSAPADTPFLPRNLVARLQSARQDDAAIACASSGGKLHPAIALWPVALRGRLRQALKDGNLGKVETFVRDCGAAIADWPVAPYDPFFNVNNPIELREAAAILRRHKNRMHNGTVAGV
jgi:molybdopterin-guanine dinucleotide biosynthesis protein A